MMARPPNSRAVRHREQLVQTLLRLSQVIDLLAEATGARPTLPTRQRLTLEILATAGPLRLSQLARRLGVSLPTATHTIAVLVQHGLVRRERDPYDRRAVLVGLTPAGEATLNCNDQLAATVRQALAALTDDEVEELTRELTLLLTALAQHLAGLAPSSSGQASPAGRRRHASAA